MIQPLKQIACDPACGFMVRSHDANEVKRIAKEHAKNVHKMNATDQELTKMMKTV